ncbi:MAG: hypothetical protein FRX49_00660 [Trebouxia sp. A1-2]|nr:MAG: hypothetical protein FRX49_13094 [Trebouxia sp. A1-2]KAA6429264.1 MAG: hypothetical protein FRX49_00660 [Trebouxia sp. A1-2]
MAMASSTLHEACKVQHNQDMSLLHLQHGTSEGGNILHQWHKRAKDRSDWKGHAEEGMRVVARGGRMGVRGGGPKRPILGAAAQQLKGADEQGWALERTSTLYLHTVHR